MYNIKKTFAIFLALIFAISFSTIAFASEDESGIPENAIRHTIEVTLEPMEAFVGEEGSDPCIWSSKDYTTSSDTTYTPTFVTDHRYLAYEISAIGSSGSTVSGTCTVKLIEHSSMAAIASTYVPANGTVEKIDWIDAGSGNTYLFKIMNGTGTSITVTITYYTWI